MREETTKKKIRSGQSGQGMVELGLLLPVLLLVVWGVIEFGRLLFMFAEVSNAAREAVRYGVALGEAAAADPSANPSYFDCDGMIAAGQATAVLTPLSDSDFQIAYDAGGGSPIATCPPSYPVDPGSRIVITVTHEVQPLLLFRNMDPFRIQFSTARTIVEKGIPFGGVGDDRILDGLIPPKDEPQLNFYVDEPGACQVHFEWDSVYGATGYHLYRQVFTSAIQINGDITGFRFPMITGSISSDNGYEYFLRSYNQAGEGPFSNVVTIAGCGLPPDSAPFLIFALDQISPCEGHFEWSPVDDADGYYLYQVGVGLEGDTTGFQFPESGSMPVADGEEYLVRAYNGFGEGPPSVSVFVSGCTVADLPPLPPANLAYTIDQSTPCQAHFTWDPSVDALGYRLYEVNAGLIGDVVGTRYPEPAGSTPVVDGQQYFVRAYDGDGESTNSNLATISGCNLFTYYLHTRWPPPSNCGDHDGDPNPVLRMDEDEPFCSLQLYDYNNDGAPPAGRMLLPGGPPAPDHDAEIAPSDYLAWATGPMPQSLTVQNPAVTLYYINPDLGKDILGNLYLCHYADGAGYGGCSQVQVLFAKSAPSWTEITALLPGTTVPAGSNLALFLVQDGGPQGDLPVWLMYDSDWWFNPYKSKLEFTGAWGP